MSIWGKSGDPRPALTPRWSAWAWAWGAIGVTAAFIAITVWWVSRHRGVPFTDAASHLFAVVAYHDLLREGNLGALLHGSGYYPPLTFLVGATATLVGGVNAAAPVVGENLVYVPLLALGCYGIGRQLQGPRAGFLAVVFALGSPLLIEQFHVFMIDAPEAALVTVSCWLILASERFSRIGVAALAGLAVGLGAASKEQFVLFVAGLLGVVLLRDRGWRNWRGIVTFATVALAVAAPWYAANFDHLGAYGSAALANPDVPLRGRPSLLSISNLGWYLWAVLNGLLFVPLSAFAAIGVVRAVRDVVRERRRGGESSPASVAPELLGGLFVGWLGITLTPHHDMRYTMPLIVYLAVLGTAWIARLPRRARALAQAALVLAALATTLGSSFGAGGRVRILLAGHAITTDVTRGVPPPDQLTLYADRDFNVAAPRRADDVLALFRAMRRDGITGVAWSPEESPVGDPVFDSQGVRLFVRFAGLAGPSIGGSALVSRGGEPGPTSMDPPSWNIADPRHAFLIRSETPTGDPPCVTLSDGTILTIVRGDPRAPTRRRYCPRRG